MLKLILFLLLCGLGVQLVRALRGGSAPRRSDVDGRRSVEAPFEVIRDGGEAEDDVGEGQR